MFLVKFILYFAVSFFILTVPISQDQTMFSILSQYTSPYTSKIYNQIGNFFKSAGSKTKNVGAKFLDNSVKKDVIKETMSSPTRENPKDAPDDNYTDEERQMLEQLIKKAQ